MMQLQDPKRTKVLLVTLAETTPVGMITSTIHVLILVPVFFVMMKTRALRQGKLQSPEGVDV